MVRTSRKLPADWCKYDTIGNVIPNTRIFALKTPLSTQLQNKISTNDRFTTIDLFRKLCESGRSIGLLINASNTGRYYDNGDIEGMMVEYAEVACPGRGFLEHSDIVKSFYKTVEDFLESNQDNDLLIGVHCTNGVNRSGYLICRYLIDRLGWSSHEALEAFEVSRGYPIERGSYVQALHRADKERRVKEKQTSSTNDIENSVTPDEDDDINEQRKEKRKKRRIDRDIVNIDNNNVFDKGTIELDPSITAQMMQQFFNLEQQFKTAAEKTVMPEPIGVYSYSSTLQSNSPSLPYNSPNISQQNLLSTHSLQITSSPSSIIYEPVKQASISKQLKMDSTKIPTKNREKATLVFDELTHTRTECISDDDDEFDTTESPNVDFESMGRIDVRESPSETQQRRLRRKKCDRMFAVMKRGKFWEINQMKKDAAAGQK